MHMHIVDLKNPKVLIRPSQAESTEGKNVIIGEERPEKKMLQNKTSRVATKNSTLEGLGKEKKTDSNLTSQTGSSSRLTGPKGGLTGVQTGLISAPSKSGNSSKAENKARPIFEELLAKFEKEGVIQKKKGWLDEAKGIKSTSTSSEQWDPRPHQGNCVIMPCSERVAPWFWPHPCHYTPLDYNWMHMQSYYIQYPSMYPSCVSPRPIVTSNNLVNKNLYCSKEGEKSTKQDSKYL